VAVNIKIRYKATEMRATLVVQGNETRVWFDEPQRAVTPGQAAVFYRGEELLGGGYIVGPLDSDAAMESPTASISS
jgi:tRNA-specific 2-thiouridylase